MAGRKLETNYLPSIDQKTENKIMLIDNDKLV